MNETSKHDSILKSCSILNKKSLHIIQFDSKKYEISGIAISVFLCVSIFSTVLLNAIAIVTIWNTTQLKKKASYFVILVQSSVDFTVGCIAIPLLFLQSLTPFINVDVCLLFVFTKPISFVSICLSHVTLSALAIERYIGTIHPYVYKTVVTRKRILIYVFSGVFVIFSVVVASFFSQDNLLPRVGMGIFIIYLVFTSYAYTCIYLEVRRLSHSVIRPNNDEENGKKRRLLREIKHVVTCFLVVITSFFLLVPFTLFLVFLQFGFMVYHTYSWWSTCILILTPTMNSLIFFWRNTALRKQATKIFKITHSLADMTSNN